MPPTHPPLSAEDLFSIRFVGDPRLSPDGKMVATDRMYPQSGNRDIWLYDRMEGKVVALDGLSRGWHRTWRS
jgi:hypothetical protein